MRRTTATGIASLGKDGQDSCITVEICGVADMVRRCSVDLLGVPHWRDISIYYTSMGLTQWKTDESKVVGDHGGLLVRTGCARSGGELYTAYYLMLCYITRSSV